MRKIILLLIAVLLLSGCAKEQKESYSLDEIYSDNVYGFFVKDGDLFYPVKFINDDSLEGFQWCKGDINCRKVTASTPLVAVFELSEDMPKEYFIESYSSLGFTIGSNVKIGEDGASMWLDTTNTCKNSDIETAFTEGNFDTEMEIGSINGTLPLSNVDTDVNILTGLQENKYYDISIYTGTQNKKGTICADTFVLKRKGQTDLENPLKKTTEGYFLVNLPENIKPGYYDINKGGFFEIE